MTQSEQSSTASRTDGKGSSTPTSGPVEQHEQAASKLSLESMRVGLGQNTDRRARLEISQMPRYGGGPALARDWRMIPDGVIAKMVCVTRGLANWPLVLLGPVGVGKTCAAMCLLDFVSVSRRYWTVADLCLELISVQNGEVEYGGAHIDTPCEWWKRYEEIDCVVLDELVSRDKVSDFGYEVVKRAIDLRHGKPLVVCSNGTLEIIGRVYDDRIASRLAAGTVIEMTGSDRRLEPAT